MATNAGQFSRTRSALRFTQEQRFGSLYFVDSVSGSATGGNTADGPSLTLIQAQTLATASNGDKVYVGHDHAESVAGAAAMTFSKAGIVYEGLGHGRLRPTLTWNSATADQIIISGANITFRNFVFDFTGFDAVVAAISITAANVAFEDCEFILSTGTNAPVLGVLTAATAARLRFERCRFVGPAISTSTVTAAIKHEVGIDFLIKDCTFVGKMTQAILNATAILGGRIDGCHFHIYTGTKGISLHASTVCDINNNDFVVASGTAPIVATLGNFTKNAYTTEGIGVNAGVAATW